VHLSPGLCPDFSYHPSDYDKEIDDYINLRISQVYGIINTALVAATLNPDGAFCLHLHHRRPPCHPIFQVDPLIFHDTIFHFDTVLLFKCGLRFSGSLTE
jgi:hypothetical protein